MDHSEKKRLLILGGGFAGLYLAKALEKPLRKFKDLDVTLINNENYFLYTPMLPEVASGSIETRHILTPFRELFTRIRFIRADITQIDLGGSCVHLQINSNESSLHYDYLVIALGGTVNKTMVSGAREFAISLKEVSDALMIRNRVIEMFELANVETNPDKRKAMLTFTVAGGGFSGVEIAGAVLDLCMEILRFYPNIDHKEIRVLVVEGRDRLLMELPEDLALYAQRVLQEEGIALILNRLMAEVTADTVRLSDGTVIPSRTVIWTTGVSIAPMLAGLPCEKDKRCRLRVNEYLELLGYPGVWSLGDCAMIPDLLCPEASPDASMAPTAQNAVREARVLAGNIIATLEGRPEKRKQFLYRPIGEFVLLGHHNAVAMLQGVKVRGMLAWMMWRAFYLLKLPSGHKKLRVAMDWILDFIVSRDTTQIKLVPSELLEVQSETSLEARIQDLEEEVAELESELEAKPASDRYRSTA